MPRYSYSFASDYEARDIANRFIHNYSYKPAPIISRRQRESFNALTFGTEVEMELPRGQYNIHAVASAARVMTELSEGRVYMKRDGSVGNGSDNSGFEMVSHPATLASHMYDAHWSGIFSKARKHGLRSHDAKSWGGSCGLHIHVGRQQLASTDEARNEVVRKVKVLVYRHWAEMTIFSRRDASQLQGWASRELSEASLSRLASAANPAATAAEYIRTRNSHGDRYIAVNCENTATIEFRLFNGTLKRDTFMASLQLVNNICRYAMSHDWSDVLSCSFLDMALLHRFNELDSYLLARGLANESNVAGRAQNTQRIPSHNGYDGVEA